MPVLEHGMTLDVLRQVGFNLTAMAEALVVEGVLSRERMEALHAGLEAASASSSLFFYGGVMVGAGQVPA